MGQKIKLIKLKLRKVEKVEKKDVYASTFPDVTNIAVNEYTCTQTTIYTHKHTHTHTLGPHAFALP